MHYEFFIGRSEVQLRERLYAMNFRKPFFAKLKAILPG